MSNPYDGLVQNKPENVGEKIMGKGLFRSKTVWVNILTAVVSVGTYFMNSELLVNNPEIVGIGGAIIGGINVLLRLLTKEPITSVK